MSTVYFIIQQSMFFAIPLLVVALGALFSEKSGISNIGLEGIMIFGAFIGILTMNLLSSYIGGQLLFIIVIIVAALAGGLLSMLHAWTSIRLMADQNISGTAINLFAPAFCIFIARTIYGARQVAFSVNFFIDEVPYLSKIPVIGPCFFTNTYISTYIGFVLLIVVNFILNKTRLGLRLSSCGENPYAAASVGIPVTKMRYLGVLISGLLGGAGGLIFVVTTSTEFASTVAGYGFLALAVLILGQWQPKRILLSSLFFGLMKAVSSSYSGIPFLASLNIDSEIYKMLPYFLTIIVLILSKEGSASPKSLAIPYDDGEGILGTNEKDGIKKPIIASILIVVIFVTATLTDFDASERSKIGESRGYGAQLAYIMGSSGAIDDKSYNQSIWEGMVQHSLRTGKTVKYYKSKDESDENLYNEGKIAAKGNAKTMIVGSSVLGKAVGKLQVQYPDIRFIQLEGTPLDDEGNVFITDNTACFEIAAEQAGFLAGYAACYDGYRSFGFIGGIAVSGVVDFGYGYVAGIEYCAKELGLPDGSISLKYNYAGTFDPTPEVLSMATSWYRSGTEVIFACGGGLGNAVMKAAESIGGKVIGVDVDQSSESETVITSAIKNLRDGIDSILQQIDEGEITFGKTYDLSTKQNAVALPMENSKFTKFNQETYDNIYQKLANDEIELFNHSDVTDVTNIPLQKIVIQSIK